MRVRHRWLWLSISVATILIVLAILGSKRPVYSAITVSFVGYTNLLDPKVRCAVFLVHKEDRFETADDQWLEVEGLAGQKRHRVPMHISEGEELMPSGPSGPETFSFAVDEPLVSGRWRASWLCRDNHHPGLRERLLVYAWRHRLMPQNWLLRLGDLQIFREPGRYVTINSIWLTNSP